jgi:integrase
VISSFEKKRTTGWVLEVFRHTAASLMLAAGENVRVVAELLGNASPTITQHIYQHVMPGTSEAAGDDLVTHS